MNREAPGALAIAGLAVISAALVVVAAEHNYLHTRPGPRLVPIDAVPASHDRLVGHFDGISSSKVDIAAGNSYNVEIAASTSYHLRGWAYDDTTKEPFRGLIVSVDAHEPLVAPYGVARPDVAHTMRCPACVASGYDIVLNGSELPVGRHEIRLQFLASDDTEAVAAPMITVIVEPRKSSPS